MPSPDVLTTPCVLCIDDNETHLHLRMAVLKKAGYSVVGASSGSEALEMLCRNPVCLVLSDHMLRGTTGAKLARAMKKIKPEVPIVLHSGRIPGTMRCVDGFINKSESISYLLKLVHEFVRKHCEQTT